MVKYLKNGEKYIIREATLEDAENMMNYLDLIAGESENLTFGIGEINITLEDEKEFIDAALKADNQYFIIAEYKGKIIGNLNFASGIRPRISHAGEFGVSVAKEFWGNGIGTELITNLIDWAKENKKISKINLQVKEENKNAMKLYEKLGFEVEGLIKRTFFIDGKYYNSYFMGKII